MHTRARAHTEDAEVLVELLPGCPEGHSHRGFALLQLHEHAAAVRARVRGRA
jgi:hypothetical protein